MNARHLYASNPGLPVEVADPMGNSSMTSYVMFGK